MVREPLIDDIAALREYAGVERYARTSEALRRGGSDDEMLGNDLSSVIWRSDASRLSKGGRIELTFDLFADIPTYGVLMYLDEYTSFSASDRKLLWQHVSSVLNDEEWRAAAMLYWLAMEVFGGFDEREREAWFALSAPDPSPLQLRRVLSIAQDVPFDWKEPVYERLLDDPAWHPAIAASLSGWGLHLDGVAAREKANALIARLDLPHPHFGFAGQSREKHGLRSDPGAWRT